MNQIHTAFYTIKNYSVDLFDLFLFKGLLNATRPTLHPSLQINSCAMHGDYFVIIAFCSHLVLLTNSAQNGPVGTP